MKQQKILLLFFLSIFSIDINAVSADAEGQEYPVYFRKNTWEPFDYRPIELHNGMFQVYYDEVLEQFYVKVMGQRLNIVDRDTVFATRNFIGGVPAVIFIMAVVYLGYARLYIIKNGDYQQIPLPALFFPPAVPMEVEEVVFVPQL